MIASTKLESLMFFLGGVGIVEANTPAINWITKTNGILDIVSTVILTICGVIGAYFIIKDHFGKPPD